MKIQTNGGRVPLSRYAHIGGNKLKRKQASLGMISLANLSRYLAMTTTDERTAKLRPFFPYYGSKWNVARHYPAPRPGLLVEPFAGAAGYATFYDCPHVLLIDADQIIAGLWSFLIGTTPAEIMALPELPEVGDSVDNYTLPQEAKWLIGFWLNRGSAQPKKSRTAYSARTDKAQLNWGLRAKERIASQLSLIADWSVKHGSYDAAPDVSATWFVDPPYGDKGRYYKVQFSDFDALGAWCRSRRGDTIVCEGANATWLPFKLLGSFKSSLGRASEAVYVSATVTVPDLFSEIATTCNQKPPSCRRRRDC